MHRCEFSRPTVACWIICCPALRAHLPPSFPPTEGHPLGPVPTTSIIIHRLTGGGGHWAIFGWGSGRVNMGRTHRAERCGQTASLPSPHLHVTKYRGHQAPSVCHEGADAACLVMPAAVPHLDPCPTLLMSPFSPRPPSLSPPPPREMSFPACEWPSLSERVT